MTSAEGIVIRRGLIAANIKAARLARGISQDRLAAILGVDRRNILRWEAGTVEPSRHLAALADALGVTIADLYADAGGGGH